MPCARWWGQMRELEPLLSVEPQRVGLDRPIPQQPASASKGLETKHQPPIDQEGRHRAAAARA